MGYRDFRDTLPSNLIIFSRPLGLNYDPPLRPAFPSPGLLPRGICPWPENCGWGGPL